MSKLIDDLSKNLAGGMSRRRAFGRFLAGLGGALFLGKRASARSPICAAFCAAQSPHDFGFCVAASAHCPDGECAVISNGGSYICVPVG
jgi:hypothetical protein